MLLYYNITAQNATVSDYVRALVSYIGKFYELNDAATLNSSAMFRNKCPKFNFVY